jgi:hypothetical protein
MRWPFRRGTGRRRTPDRPEWRPSRRAAAAEPAFVDEPSVTLGFSDGSQVALDDTHPSAIALREVAATLLVQEDRG